MTEPGPGLLAPEPISPVIPMDRRPTFAVVTAIYQGADVIAENAAAILGGTLPPDEYIICDDGSTDGLVEALAPFGDRIKLIRKENGGAASAYNVAIRAAESDFVVQTDHDDTFQPGRLEAIAEAAVARPDLDVIATDALMELEGRVVGTYREFNPFPVTDQRDAILRGCCFGWPAIRRELMLSIGGFDERRRIDWDWDCWIKLVLAGAVVGLVDEPLYRWRLRHESLSARVIDNLREDLVIFELLLREHPGLTAKDRSTIDEVVSGLQRKIALLDARASLVESRPDARRRQIDVLFGRRYGVRTRAKAAAAFVAPGLAGRRLERQIAASDTGGWDLADR
jgi:glycosyltransferase involved in cell wall biosynthesis